MPILMPLNTIAWHFIKGGEKRYKDIYDYL